MPFETIETQCIDKEWYTAVVADYDLVSGRYLCVFPTDKSSHISFWKYLTLSNCQKFKENKKKTYNSKITDLINELKGNQLAIGNLGNNVQIWPEDVGWGSFPDWDALHVSLPTVPNKKNLRRNKIFKRQRHVIGSSEVSIEPPGKDKPPSNCEHCRTKFAERLPGHFVFLLQDMEKSAAHQGYYKCWSFQKQSFVPCRCNVSFVPV